ncbi:hypothetical protein B296_00052649 [Ensete ventricosum]|uniref:F-box domain-containing protein n=1 Tax=Ensete ventricosum TaxID=4639 RepID=A0A426Y4E3_ENSVE|nr:hypothetical protein B296_00052649 [Ensete ventricosum]
MSPTFRNLHVKLPFVNPTCRALEVAIARHNIRDKPLVKRHTRRREERKQKADIGDRGDSFSSPHFEFALSMADRSRAFCIEELPAHLILEILSCGRLGAADLACLDATCRMFRGADGLFPDKFRSLVEFAAFHICNVHPIFGSLPHYARANLLDRCNGNWKRVLRFLQSVEQSSSSVETSAGNVYLC